MGGEWRELKDFVRIKGGKRLPKGLTLQSTVNEHPYIRVCDMGSRFIPKDKLQYVPNDVFPYIKNYIVAENDVILSIVGTVGLVSIVDSAIHKASQTENCAKLSGLQKEDSLYLYYCLISPLGQEEIGKHTVGAVQPKLPLYGIEKINIPWPEASKRNYIAQILGSLDDKIELNRKMNATLEGMAQALFKSWFVDFDPVIDNALVAGNPIPEELSDRAEIRKQALANGTANREVAKDFPDRFYLTEEMGWVPEGWEVKPFGAILENTVGGDWGKENEDEKHTVHSVIIRGTDIPQIAAGERSAAPRRWVEPKKFATRQLRDSDIVIEISGGSPTQSTGRSLLITENIIRRLGGIAEPASFCRRFRPLNRTYGLYGGLHLANIYKEGKMWEYQNQSTGISNFQTTSFLEREFVVIPLAPKILDIFDKTVRPFFEKITGSQQEQLARLRDSLIAKLISGEIRVLDAEKLVVEKGL